MWMNKLEICSDDEVALKSFFLGPQSENKEWLTEQINHIFANWFQWRQGFHPEDGKAISEADLLNPEFKAKQLKTSQALKEVCQRFENEIPKFSPRYIGHMLSEISLPALLGHIQTLIHNPNNISGESSRIGLQFENEALSDLTKMLGWKIGYGHFTGGGTIANFEMLFRARARLWEWLSAGVVNGIEPIKAAHMGWEKFDQLNSNKADELNPLKSDPISSYQKIAKLGFEVQSPVLLVPSHKHYSWTKGAYIFGIGTNEVWNIPLDKYGHASVEDLKILIDKAIDEKRPILAVVSVLGTTEFGFIDPVHEIQNLLDQYSKEQGLKIWHHVDGAYGGFLCSMKNGDLEMKNLMVEKSWKAIEAVERVDSITMDPHKLAYVPYSCGTFLAQNPRDYFSISFGAPYVNFEKFLDKGPFTIEGSRAATGAVATWMTSRCVGFNSDGYGKIIGRTIFLRKELEIILRKNKNIVIAPSADTNLLGFAIVFRGEKTSISNERSLKIYETLNSKTSQFFVSKTKLNLSNYGKYLREWFLEWDANVDTEDFILIRICIMNPFLKTKEMRTDLMSEFVSLIENIAGI